MYELVPLVAGGVAGLLLWGIRSMWFVAAALVAISLVAGVFAATASGELQVSAAFLLWDVGQGIAAGAAVLVLTRRLARPPWHSARGAGRG